MSRPSDPKKWKDVDVSKGTRLILDDLSCSLAGRIQKCYSNCYFSPFNVDFFKNVDISVDRNCYF